MNLYILLGYNNYYNRIIKKYDTITEYEEYVSHIVQNTNFVPNDGVNTTHVVGSNVNMYSGAGDYVLVVNEFNNIVSRWFIIESVRDRAGQYTLKLHRDLVADFYEAALTSPMFIEKATLLSDNPLIFNSENIDLNQIKTSETLIKDKSKCPWIVGYYAKDAQDMTGTVPVTADSIPYIQLSSPIDSWEYAQYTTDNPFHGNITSGTVKIYSNPQGAVRYVVVNTNIFNGESSDEYHWGNSLSSLESVGDPYGIWCGNITIQYLNKGLGLIQEQYKSYTDTHTEQELNDLLNYNGQVVRDTEGKLYRVTISNVAETSQRTAITAGSLFNTLSDIVANAGFTTASGGYHYYFTKKLPNEHSFAILTKYESYAINLERLYQYETTYNLTGNRVETQDSPWNIFAIPYGNIKVLDNNNSEIVTTNGETGIAIAMAMQVQQQSKIFDIQLLPYCPIQELITEDGEITVENNLQYSLVTENNTSTAVGIIFNVNKSVFSFNITDITIPAGTSAIEKKLNNECDKYRITSPNFSNYFEFNAEKNGGIQYFNVDCNYKPFTPYIHINPNFAGLYGKDFNDPRGLILGGDFSLSQVIDHWEQYQIQNKNFQNIFDRQIQNMEVKNSIARKQEAWQVAAGTVSGATGGAIAGASAGPYGALAGAIVGGAASLAGGIADVYYNETLRTEAIDYSKDLFGYQLGNIKALPQTISKVSAFNPNNKIFPIIEYYTCTDVEKTALLNKLAYNGMTVMTIGTIRDYMANNWEYNGIKSKGYVKGQLIRFGPIDEFLDDFHLINSLASELYKGVYLEWE